MLLKTFTIVLDYEELGTLSKVPKIIMLFKALSYENRSVCSKLAIKKVIKNYS